jgi:hypothetical protein
MNGIRSRWSPMHPVPGDRAIVDGLQQEFEDGHGSVDPE